MVILDKDPIAQLSLPPGFRFFPTDEELLVEYLCRKVAGHEFSLPIIAEVDLYKFDPWILPRKALFGEKEWYFFSPRDRKYPNGSRPNRVAGSGYWKATGTDKAIVSEGRKVGIKKALVFYIGKAPKGTKTNWIMHEYRISDPPRKSGTGKLDDWVLCRIYKKTSGKEIAAAAGGYSSPSTSASASQLDEVLESLPEIDDRRFALPRMNSLRRNQQEEEGQKTGLGSGPGSGPGLGPGLLGFGSGSIDWSMLAGLTAPHEIGAHSGADVCVPNLPGLCHVESPQGKAGDWFEEEVESGIRNQRVGSQNPNMMMGQSYLSSGDPFGIRFMDPDPMTGFGLGG